MSDSLHDALGKIMLEKDEHKKKELGKTYIEVLENFVQFHEAQMKNK